MHSFHGTAREDILNFTGDRELADYQVWKLQKQADRDSASNYGCYQQFKVKEASFMEVTRDKDFKEYIEERKKDLHAQLKKEEECKLEDEKEIDEIKKKIVYLDLLKA